MLDSKSGWCPHAQMDWSAVCFVGDLEVVSYIFRHFCGRSGRITRHNGHRKRCFGSHTRVCALSRPGTLSLQCVLRVSRGRPTLLLLLTEFVPV